jgi:hypothetical protein
VEDELARCRHRLLASRLKQADIPQAKTLDTFPGTAACSSEGRRGPASRTSPQPHPGRHPDRLHCPLSLRLRPGPGPGSGPGYRQPQGARRPPL